MNELAKTSPAETARNHASEWLHTVADMTLHQLVDEFVALTETIKTGTSENPQTFAFTLTDEAKVAVQNRNLVNGATRARFGIEFDVYDGPF